MRPSRALDLTGDEKSNTQTDLVSITRGIPSTGFLRNSSVALVGYASIHDIEQLRDYLIPRVRSLAFLAIQTVYVGSVQSSLVLYENGKLIRRLRRPPRLGRSLPFYRYLLPFLYLLHVSLFVLSTLRVGRVFDLYLGVSYQSALAGAVLKRLGLAKKIVYYSFDYFPTTEPSTYYTRMTSRIFQILDRVCVTHSDIVWNLSEEIQRIRSCGAGPRVVPEISVPHPIVVSERIKAFPDGPYIAFIGSLRKSQGVDLIIDALPAIRERVPLVKLFVIGSGPYLEHLRSQALSAGVDHEVEFLGFVASEARVGEILSSCAFGVAPYAPGEASFIWYADPGKIKKYLSCGLPVIVTAGPRFAEYLQKRRAGFAINHDQQALARAAVSLLTEDQTLREYRRNALAVASEFDVNDIFDNAFLASRKLIVEKSPASYDHFRR